MKKNGFIKLDRKILDWRWYSDANTARVFFHLLLIANYEDKPFEKVIIRRGEAVVSYPKIAQDLGLTIQQARTAISHLKSTGEITATAYPKFSVIKLNNYNHYQGFNRQNNRQSTGNQQAKHQSNNNIIRNKEYNTTYYKRNKEGADAPNPFFENQDAPPEGFSTWEEYYDYLSE